MKKEKRNEKNTQCISLYHYNNRLDTQNNLLLYYYDNHPHLPVPKNRVSKF